MGLEAASVKAQVRIGGNTAPSAAAVLDLNASDAANLATGGLVLPRVDLNSTLMQLTPGVANQTGTMVYNVTTTLGRIGVYYWNGNRWVLASLPSISAADSGKFLVATATGWDFAYSGFTRRYNAPPLTNAVITPSAVSWQKVGDFKVSIPPSQGYYYVYDAPGILNGDLCYSAANYSLTVVWATSGQLTLISMHNMLTDNTIFSVRCYRPSA